MQSLQVTQVIFGDSSSLITLLYIYPGKAHIPSSTTTVTTAIIPAMMALGPVIWRGLLYGKARYRARSTAKKRPAATSAEAQVSVAVSYTNLHREKLTSINAA